MEKLENYDVLRLIEHGDSCYISCEYVEGMPLIYWLSEHSCMKKENLFHLITEMVRQLELLHRCKGNPCFKYVNPYCLIVTEKEQKLYYLDMNAASNREVIRQMQKKSVREHFLPEEDPYYRNASVAGDIYGLGRTIQYVLQAVQPEPELTGREEKAYYRLTEKCLRYDSKKSFLSVTEVRKNLPEYQKETPRGMEYRKKILVTAACILAVTIVATHEIGRITGSLSSKAMSTGEISAEEESETEGTVTEDEKLTEETVTEETTAAEADLSEESEDLKEIREVTDDLDTEVLSNRRFLEVNMLYLMLMDEHVTEKQIEKQIQKYIDEDEAFSESQEFKILQKAYQIEISEEEITFER